MRDEAASTHWTDRIIGSRMAVDREFQHHVNNAGLCNQSWELVMRAVEYEIVYDPTIDQYTITPQFDKLESVLPAIAEAESRKGALSFDGSKENHTSGIISKFNEIIGRAPRGDSYRKQVEKLATEYGRALQAHLEDRDMWEEIVAEEFPEDTIDG